MVNLCKLRFRDSEIRFDEIHLMKFWGILTLGLLQACFVTHYSATVIIPEVEGIFDNIKKQIRNRLPLGCF